MYRIYLQSFDAKFISTKSFSEYKTAKEVNKYIDLLEKFSYEISYFVFLDGILIGSGKTHHPKI